MKYVIDRKEALNIVRLWHKLPKVKASGAVSSKIMRRYSWVYQDKDCYGAIDNRAGLCEVEDGFQSTEEAEAWIESREIKKARARRKEAC
ncbi:MAG: hypothetical protein MJZ99_06970 [Bacteroidales bacterium]|nr:hypothetical protein [Bacteroidales bacterium]